MAFTSRITLLAALAVAAFQAQAVNVTVAYQTSAEPAKVAQADNTFAKTSGATVDWRKFDSGASVVRALASGDVQIGNIGSSPLAVAASQQVPIEVFLLASKLGNSEALVVKKSITKPEDLVGKTIGYGGTVLSEALVKCMMENVGADASDVNMINVGFELMSSMTTGNVDATIGCLVNHEVPQLEEEGFDVNYFSVSGYGIPNYYEEVFLTNDDLLENEPEVVAGFLRAAKKGFDDFKADPDGCLAILMNNQNEENFPLTQSVEEQSCATLIPLMETEDAAFLTQTDECWQENIDWMLENQLIDKAVDVSDVMTIVDFEN